MSYITTPASRQKQDVTASKLAISMGLNNVEFQTADIFHLPFDASSFDHVFVCFVLEHLANYKSALVELKRLLKPNG